MRLAIRCGLTDYSWDALFSAWVDAYGDFKRYAEPYPVDVLFMYMANMSWNSSMNSAV